MYQSLSTLCLTHFSPNSSICLDIRISRVTVHLPIYISNDDSPPSYINVLGSSRDLEKRWISRIAYFSNFLRSRISVLCSSGGWSKEQGLKREGLNNVGSLVDARDGLVDGKQRLVDEAPEEMEKLWGGRPDERAFRAREMLLRNSTC